jgi:outer membrane protein TolC
VERALRSLENARERLDAQGENVDLAQQNYRFAQRRVTVGVADQLELRDASDQLDEARLNYFQAVYDFLEARSRFESAVGVPVVPPPAEGVLLRDARLDR